MEFDRVDLDGIATMVRGANKSRPLYLQLASTIVEQIRSGRLPVGALLPTEAQISELCEVSRHTVRQAIQHLRHQGFVSARKGVGTRIESSTPQSSYSHSMQSLNDTIQYAFATRLEILEHRENATLRGQDATNLGARSGSAWVGARGLRYEPDVDLPICLDEIYVDTPFADVVKNKDIIEYSITAKIESDFGETILEIEQEIAPAVLDEEEAQHLDAEPNSLALAVIRRCRGTGRRILFITRSLHPADRFTYALTLKRDISGDAT